MSLRMTVSALALTMVSGVAMAQDASAPASTAPAGTSAPAATVPADTSAAGVAAPANTMAPAATTAPDATTSAGSASSDTSTAAGSTTSDTSNSGGSASSNTSAAAGSTTSDASTSAAPMGNSGMSGGGGMMMANSAAAPVKFTNVGQTDMTTNNLIGMKVYNNQNESLGEIKDLVVKDGNTVGAVIVSVGGFLGMGESYVALDPSTIAVSQQDGKWRALVDASKDTLQNAPKFTYPKTNG